MSNKSHRSACAAAAKAPRDSRNPAAPFASPRQDGWTRERQTGFIQALAESGCVEEACAAVGMSRQSAYRLRARIDAQGFRLAWDKAVDYAMRRLSDACLSRALHGEARPIFYKGEQIGERRVYDNKLAMFLLRYRDPLRYAASLDQMVYTGDVEGAAIGLVKAIHRVADEAEGLWEPEPDADHTPYTTESIADRRAREAEDAIIQGHGWIHGSNERRTRLEEKRRAYQLQQSGYKTYAEWHAAENAERLAQEAALRAELEAAFPGATRGHTPEDHAATPDSAPDVVSPSSPSDAPVPAKLPARLSAERPAGASARDATARTGTGRAKPPQPVPQLRAF